MDTFTKGQRENGQGPLITYPALYQIHIQGKLDIGWSERLAGMSITTRGGKNVTPLTILQGEVIDQSVLLGVLNTLHDLGYPVLHVAYYSENHTPEDR